jgi:hypothetical protein
VGKAKPWKRQFTDEELRESFEKDWKKVVRNYHKDPKNIIYAWRYLEEHPIFQGHHGIKWGDHMDSRFLSQFWIAYVKVNPKTRSISRNKSKNTLTEVWVESGPVYRKQDKGKKASAELKGIWGPNGYNGDDETFANVHDYRLDCGGKTFEKAIIKHAKLVYKRYGDDRSKVYR